jgi:hypothetical protein
MPFVVIIHEGSECCFVDWVHAEWPPTWKDHGNTLEENRSEWVIGKTSQFTPFSLR